MLFGGTRVNEIVVQIKFLGELAGLHAGALRLPQLDHPLRHLLVDRHVVGVGQHADPAGSRFALARHVLGGETQAQYTPQPAAGALRVSVRWK